jgi:uncharacterized protein
MLLTIQQFRQRVSDQLDGLVTDLRDATGRSSPEEAAAWRSSLPKLAETLVAPSLQPLHLYFGNHGRISLEYRLPATSSWCDCVLLGRHQTRPSAVILELKDWQTRADQPGPIEGLIRRQGSNELHPSDQVRGYAEYCQRFHSAVLDKDALVHGCVLFTKDYFCNGYRLAPNDKLTDLYPCFTLSPSDLAKSLPAYFAHRISEPDENFATAFEKGSYKQDRAFCKQIATQLLGSEARPFELLDGQRKAFAECLAAVRTAIASPTGVTTRKVVVVKGPPGCGKSAIAAKLWATLLDDPSFPPGNVVFCATSVCQDSNWSALVETAANNGAAGGVVVKANEFIPCTTQDLGQWRKKFKDPTLFENIADWRKNLEHIAALRPAGTRCADMQFLVTVVDEAHALINPEHSDARGQFGFAVAAGPQAYHIIRGSAVSVFFMDSEQSYRERETTTLADIRQWAKELGADVVAEVSLEDSQFRCNGSKEYVDWIGLILSNNNKTAAQELASIWHEPTLSPPPHGKFEFRIFDSLFKLEDALRDRINAGATARLLASFAREWKTKGKTTPHALPPSAQDFCETQTLQGKNVQWTKVWNFVPREDYSIFIQGKEGYPIHKDPLCEVGCPYVVRGFDFDYIGLLWLSDLQWRDDKWCVDPEHCFETGLPRHLSRAQAAPHPEHQDVLALARQIKRAYRILLTRAMKGAYVWFENPATAAAVQSVLSPSASN